jgi:hypothetical protein
MENLTRIVWCDSPEEIETKKADMLAAGEDISGTLFVRWWTKEEANAQLESGDAA